MYICYRNRSIDADWNEMEELKRKILCIITRVLRYKYIGDVFKLCYMGVKLCIWVQYYYKIVVKLVNIFEFSITNENIMFYNL